MIHSIRTAGLAVLLIVTSSASALGAPKPKYGPEATPLSRSHEYFQKASAPDFWLLIPYYAAQQDDASCSVASVAMVVNAARAAHDVTKLAADDELATQKALLQKVQLDGWKGGMINPKRGVILDELGPLLVASLKAYGIAGAHAETVHFAQADSANLQKLRKMLEENERSGHDFIVLNFLQGIYTGDASVGHIAPVGAYDAAHHRVLVMDPDRQWYEPYWVSDETLLKGMATLDSSISSPRGLVWVRVE